MKIQHETYKLTTIQTNQNVFKIVEFNLLMVIMANLINHPILKIIAEGKNTHLVDHVKLPSSDTKLIPHTIF